MNKDARKRTTAKRDMESITIRITEASEGGYIYDLYKFDAINELAEPWDGGQCTTTMLNALGMAVQEAEEIIKAEKGTECLGCGEDIEKKGGVKSATHMSYGMMCSPCIDRMNKEGDFIQDR